MTIVCAAPRSGATIFAKSLAEKQNAYFVNELTPNFLDVVKRGNMKAIYHELHYQPRFSVEDFFKYSNNPTDPSIVILANSRNSHWIFKDASYFMTRRKIRTWMKSLFNFWFKTNPASIHSPLALDPYMQAVVDQTACMLLYCKMFDKQVTFYEDTEFYRESAYDNFDQFNDPQILEHIMLKYVEQTNLVDLYPGLTYD